MIESGTNAVRIALSQRQVPPGWAREFIAHVGNPGEDTGFPSFDLVDAVRSTIKERRSRPETSTPHIGTFILKTVADCNLRCTYPCFEYVDDAWSKLPPTMSEVTMGTIGTRIGEYAAGNNLKKVKIVFHGGEPLYMHQPESYYDRIIPTLLGRITSAAPNTNVDLGMQTNAVLLRPAILDVLNRYNVGVGVSLDGPAVVHDRYRKVSNGKAGSHALTMKGLEHLSHPDYKHLARGLICVVKNVDSNPLEVDDFLTKHSPAPNHKVHYTLDYATHDNPPQPGNVAKRSDTPYADWLLRIFWRRLAGGTAQNVPLFKSIMQLTLGGYSSTEAIGPYTGNEMIFRTDGSAELVDALRVTAGGATVTNMHAATHSIENVATLLRQHDHLGKKSVADSCKPCPVLKVCGGGHIASRYSEARGFNNASVYCKDLEKLVRQIGGGILHIMYEGMASVLRQDGVLPNLDHSDCSKC